MNWDQGGKIGRSALISAAGAACAYVAGVLASGELNLGVYGPLAAAVAAWLVNLFRELAKSPDDKTPTAGSADGPVIGGV